MSNVSITLSKNSDKTEYLIVIAVIADLCPLQEMYLTYIHKKRIMSPPLSSAASKSDGKMSEIARNDNRR